MIKVENIQIHGFESAVIAMRNPMNSWDKSDSIFFNDYDIGIRDFILGKNDLDLMKRLYKAGTEHRTYARMIYIWMDITAPLYFWKEADRYTVGKSQVSCSTMHKIAAKEFELDDFSHEHLYVDNLSPFCPKLVLCHQIDALNFWRKRYLETKNKSDWWQMIQLLPSSYNQRRTICLSYEVVFKIIKERTGHKLDEWNDLIEVFKTLPYIKEITED